MHLLPTPLSFCSACTVEPQQAFSFAPQPAPVPAPIKRRQLYAGTLSKLRQLMICRMAKPEEVRHEQDKSVLKSKELQEPLQSAQSPAVVHHVLHDTVCSQRLQKYTCNGPKVNRLDINIDAITIQELKG